MPGIRDKFFTPRHLDKAKLPQKDLGIFGKT